MYYMQGHVCAYVMYMHTVCIVSKYQFVVLTRAFLVNVYYMYLMQAYIRCLHSVQGILQAQYCQ